MQSKERGEQREKMQRGEHGQMKRACTALSSWSSECKVGLTAGEESSERRKAECRERD